jgi:Fe-S cluster assembly protein SufD
MSAIAKFKSRYRADNSDLGLIDWDRLSPASAEWVNALRRRAQINFSDMGVPTQKLERWKYTNLPAKLKKMELSYKDADITLSGLTDYAYSFPKGMLHFPQWAQDMVERDAPSQDKYGDMALWGLADAYLKDGFILDVPEGCKDNHPLNVTLAGHDGTYFVPRQVIRIGAGAEFTLIEYQNGSGAYWGNIVTQIEVAKGATFKHYRFQENSDTAVMTQNTHVVMEEGAEYEAFTMTSGAKLSRNQIHVDMKGQNAICRLNGINMLDGTELSDTTITIDHCAPHCNSYQNYRTVAADKAIGVFQGKVHVHQIAQKTDGYQMAKSLLLSPQATINTKPELEIYADDVKCSHGATTGRLDDDALFYLRARGIPMAQAKNLLIQAFVSEVIEGITCDEVNEQSALIVSSWLNALEVKAQALIADDIFAEEE